MSLSVEPFHGVDPVNIISALSRRFSEVASVCFRCQAPPARSADGDHWVRLQSILSHPSVYAALGIYSLCSHADFAHAERLEVIGTLANLLSHPGMHAPFMENYEIALAESRQYLDRALRCNYETVEAYSSSVAWCDWFIDDGVFDETVLIGNRDEWWLLVATWTD